MTADVADRVYLAALDGEDVSRAFGEGFDTATEPPAVTDLLRSLADTRVWATRETAVLAELDRGDYVVFHRDWGIRCVAQVWATTADSDDVAAHTGVDEPAGEWGLVTLTNVQRALDHVSLLSLDAGDAQREASLYRIAPDVAADLESRFTTPARLVEELVPDPLAFDVPPGGTPPDRRPDAERPAGGASAGDADALLDAHLDALDGVHRTAWRTLALGGFLFAATLALAARYRPPGGDPFALSATVGAGALALGVGAAVAAGVAVHGVVSPRPGLDAFASEHAAATARAGRTERGSDAAAHLGARLDDLTTDLAAHTRRLGLAVAASTVAVLVGCVYVAYGLAAQVSTAVRPLSVAVLVGFPLAVVAVAALVVRERDGSVAAQLGDATDRLSSLSGRLR